MSLDVNYNLKPENVGSESYFFQGTGGVEITLPDGTTRMILPIAAQDYFTGEVSEAYERSYFIIKWFSGVDPVTMADVSGDSGTVTFSGSPDPEGLGDRRYKTVSNGSFTIASTDTPDRTIPASSGPIVHARLNISEIPASATHFYAYLVKY